MQAQTREVAHSGVDFRSLAAALFSVRWAPNRDTLVALGSYGLVVAGLYLAFQVVTTAQVAANFILFGPITLVGLGVALPAFYTAFARRRSLADLGVTTKYLLPSLAIGLLLGLNTYQNTLALVGVTWSTALVPLVAMSVAVGLFEAVFFRGWLQLRFEAAFGLVPGLLLAALCYSLYHVGYGMTADEMVMLFGLGVVFAAVFRLTKNVAILWPLYTPIGGLYTTLGDGLALPFEATYGFVLTLAFMAAAIAIAATRRQPTPRA